MTTPKKHTTNNPAWVDALFGPVYLDFVAPFPLETSLKRLKREEETGFFRYRKTRVDLLPDDPDNFDFYIKRWGSRSATIEARGHLKRWESDSTLVIARVNIALYNYLILLPMIVIALVVFFPMFARMAWFALFFVVIMIFNWVYMRTQCHSLAHLIEKTLHADLDVEGDSPLIDPN